MNLQHLTINTGHNHPCNRFEVWADTIKACEALIGESLSTGAPVGLPPGDWAHLQCICVASGHHLLVTVYGPAGPHVAGQAYHGKGVPIVSCGIDPHARDGLLFGSLLDLYQAMYQSRPKLTAPAEPWLATVICPSAQPYSASLPMLADFCRSMAWAWVDGVRKNS